MFGVDVKLYGPPFMYKINAHNMSGVRSWAVILTEGLEWPIMYVLNKIKKLEFIYGLVYSKAPASQKFTELRIT